MDYSSILTDPHTRRLSAEEYLTAKKEFEVSPRELQVLLEEEPDTLLVVDARDHASYEKEHILGAKNVPERELAARMGTLPKSRRLIVYSWDLDCPLAADAAFRLARSGREARILVGGLEEWRRRGLPVTKRTRGS
jgi:rhodanese-related sulfurtransferase